MELLLAIKNNNISKVKEILDSGIDINAEDKWGNIPLQYACLLTNIQIVELFLSYPTIDVNKQDSNNKQTALHILSQTENVNSDLASNIIKLLLARPEIDINIQDSEGNTFLYYALNGYQEHVYNKIAIDVLQNPKFDVTIKNNSKETLLHKACKRGLSSIVKILLEKPEIDVNAQDITNKFSPLYISCSLAHFDSIKLLLSHPKINVNIKDKDNNFPLLTPIPQVTQLLLAHPKINVNNKDTYGDTALHKMCYDADYEIINLLLKNPNIDVNVKNNRGETPLYESCLLLRNKVTKLLLDHPNIDVNVKNNENKSLLKIVCELYDLEIVELLLKNKKTIIDFDYSKFSFFFKRGNTYNKLRTMIKQKRNIYLEKVITILDSVEE